MKKKTLLNRFARETRYVIITHFYDIPLTCDFLPQLGNPHYKHIHQIHHDQDYNHKKRSQGNHLRYDRYYLFLFLKMLDN